MNGQHNNTTTYSAADLLRYLDGRMDRAELLALERAMLDDEMLADSVEGYRMMRETHSDEIILAKAYNLNTPIPKEKENEKKIAPVVSFSKFRWLGYAAAASLVVAAGWWVFSTTRPENILPSEINDQANPAFVSADPADSGSTESQTGLADNNIVASEEKSSKKTEAELPVEKKTASKANDVAKLNQEKSSVNPASAPTLSEETLSGKNIDSKLSESAPGMRAVRAAPTVAGNENPPLHFSLTDSANAIPMAGWDYYREYLDSKLDFPSFTKPVVIDINLNAGGKITDVLVEGPIGDKEKMYIIQSIKAGPTWKNKHNKAAKATIQFQ